MDFKKFLPWIIVAVIVIGLYGWASGIYNTAVTLEQDVKESWGNVNTSYQRRNDLIPNIVNTVKGYAEHEKSTLTAVIEARAKATSVTIDPANVTPEQLAAFNSAQSGVSSSLSKLLVSVEQYPNLKADQQYINFQREYTAIENSIRTETVYYNDAAKVSFNNLISLDDV